MSIEVTLLEQEWVGGFKNQHTEHDGTRKPKKIVLRDSKIVGENTRMIATIGTVGATLLSLKLIDDHGEWQEMTVRQDHKVLPGPAYEGATCGRVANRIKGAAFELDGKRYQLPKNHGAHMLHGGEFGFHGVNWEIKDLILLENEVGVELEYISRHLEEGFPAEVIVTCRYTLSLSQDAAPELRMLYTAEISKDSPAKATVVNICNHAYWNLSSGEEGHTVMDHLLYLPCPSICEVDKECIPSGTLGSVKGTAFDFTIEKRIGQSLDQVGRVHGDNFGYDHCFTVLPPTGKTIAEKEREKMICNFGFHYKDIELSLIARLTDPSSKRKMTVYTTQPGVQVYTANFMPGPLQHSCVALETQHFPDSINQPTFPSTVLRFGEEYRQATVHRFEM